MSSGAKPKSSKTAGRSVPSRHKQAATKVAGQSSVSGGKSKSSRSGSLPSGSSSQDSTDLLPESSSSQGSHGMTSTPGKVVFPPPLLDASAITDARRHLAIPCLKETIVPIPSSGCIKKNLRINKLQNETLKPCGSVTMLQKDEKKSNSNNLKIADAELDLSYAIYLQAAFLESEAKKALHARFSNAKEILHKLYSLVLQHLTEVRSREVSLRIISSLIEAHEHCQKQENILRPVFEIIPSVVQQYKSLAEAVNATKHRLHVKDVVLPETGSEGEVIEILQKMTQFVSEFFKILPNYKDIISSVDDLKNYADAAEVVAVALERGLNLQLKARELIFSEASLAVGL